MTLDKRSLRIRGYCPGCGLEALYANPDGTIDCENKACKNKGAALAVLSYPYSNRHIVNMMENGSYNLQHPLLERAAGSLFDCNSDFFLRRGYVEEPDRPGLYYMQYPEGSEVPDLVRLPDAFQPGSGTPVGVAWAATEGFGRTEAGESTPEAASGPQTAVLDDSADTDDQPDPTDLAYLTFTTGQIAHTLTADEYKLEEVDIRGTIILGVGKFSQRKYRITITQE